MREFAVGLMFLLAVLVFLGMWFLLLPLLLIMGLLLRFVLGFIFVILAIWLLGKFIMFIWGRFKERPAGGCDQPVE